MDPDLAAALAAINDKIDTIKIHISGLPLIATSLHELRDDVRELRRETRLVKAAINDMARVNITAGEARCCTRSSIRSPTRRSTLGRG